MALSAGAKLGPYEIVAPLGAGAMGEVYRAKDTRLGREVAVKVLPASLSGDADRLQRFEQEARATGMLNHPNILAIYDIGTHEGSPYLVTELLEGETLRDRLAGLPLAVSKTVDVALETARGLAAAHEKGIVHRDLKPENLFLTKDGRVKILDFGLAKLTQALPQGEPEPNAPTVAGLTQAGLILGTAGYMSPEQASGRPVDFRSDQFSFGAILYEIAGGRRAFDRSSIVETLSAIIREEPSPLGSLNPLTPAPVRWLVERCLAKDADDRFASTRDLVRDLEGIRNHLSEISQSKEMPAVEQSAGEQPALEQAALEQPALEQARGATRRTRLLVAAGLAAGLLAGAGLGLWLAAPKTSEPPTLRYLTYSGRDSSPAASPDGRTIAFTSDRDGRRRIWLKDLAGGGEQALTAGPDDFPRFSPDSSNLLFTRTEGGRQALYRTAILGGEPRKLVDDVTDGDWSPDGRQIVFTRLKIDGPQAASVVGLAGANGGGPREIARVEGHWLGRPRWSPDGRTIATTDALGQAGTPSAVFLVSTDGKQTRSVPAPSGFMTSSVAWSKDGDEVVYCQAESAVGRITGAAGRVIRQSVKSGAAQTVFWSPQNALIFDIAGPGRVVFDTRSPRENLREMSVLSKTTAAEARWLTRGNSTDRQPAYSPDAEWIIFSSNRSGNLDLWEVSPRTGAVRRVTDDGAEDWDPTFSPDGKKILWSSNRSGHFEIWMADADGSGARQLSHDGVDAENPAATPDGQWIFYGSGNPAKAGLWRVRQDGSEATRVVAGIVAIPEVSADGQYVLYTTGIGVDRSLVRVARAADGASVPFEIRIDVRRPGTGIIGRSRWMRGTKGAAAIAFVGQDEKGANGVFAQDFVPGQDTIRTRRPLGSFSPEITIESFGLSPDGARMTVAGSEQLSSLMLAEGVPGIASARRGR